MCVSTDSKGLSNPSEVEALREKVYASLEAYCKQKYPEQPGRYDLQNTETTVSVTLQTTHGEIHVCIHIPNHFHHYSHLGYLLTDVSDSSHRCAFSPNKDGRVHPALAHLLS